VLHFLVTFLPFSGANSVEVDPNTPHPVVSI